MAELARLRKEEAEKRLVQIREEAGAAVANRVGCFGLGLGFRVQGLGFRI